MGIRETIFVEVETIGAKFMYYDRKEDEDLPLYAIEQAIADGVITVDEIVTRFRTVIERP